MKAHWDYLKYVLRHKKFVWVEGRKLNVGRLQLLVHDWQKFTPTEWRPYVDKFYRGVQDKHAFNTAWHHHVRYGKHHWQYWVIFNGMGKTVPLKMPEKYRREMLADWRAAGMAQGKGNDAREWYEKYKHRMLLHEATRAYIERNI